MTDGVKITFRGLPEFSARLKALGVDMEKKIVRSAAMAAGTVFKKTAAMYAPMRKKGGVKNHKLIIPGLLKRSIYAFRSRRNSKPGLEVVMVSAKAGGKFAKTNRDAYYWRWVEGGHLVRGPGQKIRGGKRRAALERSRLTARGAASVPPAFFLKNAFNDSQDAALDAFNLRIEQRIQRANKELNSK